jgi:hypothetical protein
VPARPSVGSIVVMPRKPSIYENVVNGEGPRRVQRGKITQFLRRNLFTVELSDGQSVTAVMPSNLIHLVVNFRHGLSCRYIAVAVEVRKPPRLARIVDAVESGLLGGEA